MDDLHIEIRPSLKEQLDFLQAEFSPHDFLGNHHKRHEVQQSGNGLYLIAWHNSKPVGHFLLRWYGPDKDKSGKYPYPTPYIEAGGTRIEYRRKGVATKLLREVERIAKNKGYAKVGLAVGSNDNPDAKRLYQKFGFIDWGEGEFKVSWDFKNAQGTIGVESETCIYMFKVLE